MVPLRGVSVQSYCYTVPKKKAKLPLSKTHPKLAKEEFYYKTPPHQDWPSMLSSMDSLVVWVPLVDVNEKNGSILIYPGSHKYGDLSNSVEGGFAKIDGFDSSRFSEIQPELEVGDIITPDMWDYTKDGDEFRNKIRKRESCYFLALQPILHHAFTMGCEYTFGVKLKPVNWMACMLKCHDVSGCIRGGNV